MGHSLLTSGVKNRTEIYTIGINIFNDVEILIFFLPKLLYAFDNTKYQMP